MVDNLTSQSLSSFSVLEFENEWFALFWLVIMSIIIIKVLVFDKKNKIQRKRLCDSHMKKNNNIWTLMVGFTLGNSKLFENFIKRYHQYQTFILA